MIWTEAKALAKIGLHVRRETWPAGTWLIYQRGIAWFWTGTDWRVVAAGDFGAAEWLAVDWTQIPEALADCPPAPPEVPTPPATPPAPPGPTDPTDPADPPSGLGSGGSGGATPTPPPIGPTPPRPPDRPGCVAPALSCSAFIYCPDQENPTSKRVTIGATLSGGDGSWSLKARIGGRLIPLGLVTAPGTASADTFVNCADGDNVLVYVTASGFGDCSPRVISATASAACECGQPGCMNPHAVNYSPSATTDDGSCVTCASAGNCVVPDPDYGANPNNVGNGACDQYCETANDCSPSFGSAYTSPNGVYYPSCYG